MVAHELFVEARLRLAGSVLILRPEPRRVRRQHFVDEHERVAGHAKLEFRVRDDDAVLVGVLDAALVELERQLAKTRDELRARRSRRRALR